jgi:hypothetical protein
MDDKTYIKHLKTRIKVDQQRGQSIQSLHDGLWKWCKDNNMFEGNESFKDYLIWIEHEVSRHCNGLRYKTP